VSYFVSAIKDGVEVTTEFVEDIRVYLAPQAKKALIDNYGKHEYKNVSYRLIR